MDGQQHLLRGLRFLNQEILQNFTTAHQAGVHHQNSPGQGEERFSHLQHVQQKLFAMRSGDVQVVG